MSTTKINKKYDAKEIVRRCGGSMELAYRLGVYQLTVNNWEKRGSIPIKYHRRIAEVFGVILSPIDFGASEK